MFTEKGFSIYVLDGYSVYLMPEFRQALFKKNTFLLLLVLQSPVIYRSMIQAVITIFWKVIIGNLKLKQCLSNWKKIQKISSPSRNEMIHMLLQSWELLQVDTQREFKSLFVINALDGSEFYLVSDKLYALVGNKMMKFRQDLMLSQPAKTLKEVIWKLISPKGVKRKGNIEMIQLLDCEDE